MSVQRDRQAGRQFPMGCRKIVTLSMDRYKCRHPDKPRHEERHPDEQNMPLIIVYYVIKGMNKKIGGDRDTGRQSEGHAIP